MQELLLRGGSSRCCPPCACGEDSMHAYAWWVMKLLARVGGSLAGAARGEDGAGRQGGARQDEHAAARPGRSRGGAARRIHPHAVLLPHHSGRHARPRQDVRAAPRNSPPRASPRSLCWSPRQLRRPLPRTHAAGSAELRSAPMRHDTATQLTRRPLLLQSWPSALPSAWDSCCQRLLCSSRRLDPLLSRACATLSSHVCVFHAGPTA